MIGLQNLSNRMKRLFEIKINGEPRNLTHVLEAGFHRIDENTQGDLLVDDINTKLNKTRTTFGEELFDHWLKNTKSSHDLLVVQEDTKRVIESNSKDEIIQILNKTGKQYRGHIVSDLWYGFEIKSLLIDNILIISLVNLLLLAALSFLFSQYILIWALIFLFTNVLIYLTTNPYISEYSGSINYLLKGIRSIRKIDKKNLDNLSVSLPNYPVFSGISWYSLLLGDGNAGSNPNDLDLGALFINYLRVFLNWEAIAFNITSKIVLKNLVEIRRIIYFLGYYDCISNNVTITEEYESSFIRINEEGINYFEDIYHPLIENPVKQSKEIEKGLIITGLNMAGKSTFMRTYGINQLLGTTLGICFAKEMNVELLKIITSFRINDSLLKNKSRYFAEAERLSEIISFIKKERALCFIDEILSGTNTSDRIYGSIEILKRLSENKESIIISATHDIDIATSLKDNFELCYFSGKIEEKNILFDYKLKSGTVPERNGLIILKQLGIPISV